MSKLLQLLIICTLLWLSPLQAAPDSGVSADGTESELTAEVPPPEKAEGWSGFSIFILVFVISVLFVLSSATALTRMGGGKSSKPPKRAVKSPAASPKRSRIPQGEDRFRL